MKNIKWINVVQLNEFFNVLNIQELIELSMSSKIFRSKLIPVIYKSLKIDDSTIKMLGYKNYRITLSDIEYNDEDIQDIRLGWNQNYRRGFFDSEDSYYSDDEECNHQIDIFINPYKPLTENFIASRAKFQSDLKLIPHQPSELAIKNVRDHCYLIRELSIAFINLNSLNIHSIRVTLEDLQYLLDNLKHLEYLHFTFNYIFKCDPESIDSSINWPQTLKKLVYGRNREMVLNDKYYHIPIHPDDNHPDIPRVQHLLLPTQLHNLESLSLLSFDKEFNDRLEFLKLNSHIVILKLYFVKEIQEQSIDMQLLKKLNLCFELNEATDYVADIPIRVNVIKFPRLDNLESVKFESNSKTGTCVKIDLNNLKLKIDECPKLKFIRFNSEDNLKYFGEIASEKLGLYDNWKLIFTPCKYLLHKVNQ
ncbi:hypothetical protein CONCODRAFT_20692 [Conidiobolus coronatus NRRL 28638]|uniref:Uncharacterized protein n=1 Tax=Conidiobolus coronatus (strain ATCC 28846 / CBS 209.66 / NRRL 28638) TaxID=796925 RepID=A0A137NS02_CONC2|nr:hypothetical protein CONCODRAFT_20692 [Conidiobolus coronatus NRRL 28638]|eukprot:KXN65516.1 hypothetical protein CONCODRAFT_20692 [Conidiobolus coronatus NRRL 28638]